MKYLHTMLRIRDIDVSLRFYCEGLGLKEVRRMENAAGKFTLIFLAAPGQAGPLAPSADLSPRQILLQPKG